MSQDSRMYPQGSGGAKSNYESGTLVFTPSGTGGGFNYKLPLSQGTSATRYVNDTANSIAFEQRFDCGATSGDARAIYSRLYITGAGGGGEAVRAFCTVEDVAAATARGAHISLNWGDSGSVTGLGAALEATLHIREDAGMGGTITAIKAAIHSDAATSDPNGATTLSVFNVVSQGDETGMADVDTDCYLLDIDGFSAASGTTNMVSSTSLAELPASSIGLRIHFDGNVYYIPAVIAAQWN